MRHQAEQLAAPPATPPQLAWDQVYLDYLAKVMAVTSTRGYYRVMMQLAPLLLACDAANSVVLRLRASDGAERDETVARSGYAPIPQPPWAGFKMLPDGIA